MIRLARSRTSLLPLDPSAHVVALLDHLLCQTFFEKPLLLDPTERVAGMDERRGDQAGQANRGIAGIGVVAVDHIRHAPDLSEVDEGIVDELRQVGPQVLLVKVAVGPERQAHDPRPVGDLLEMLAVLGADVGRQDLAGHQLDPRDLGVLRERARQIEHVQNLAAGVGVPAEFGFLATNEPVETDQRDIEPISINHCSRPIRSSELGVETDDP